MYPKRSSKDSMNYDNNIMAFIDDSRRAAQNSVISKASKSSSLRSVKYNPKRNLNQKSPSENSNYSFTNKRSMMLDLDLNQSHDISNDIKNTSVRNKSKGSEVTTIFKRPSNKHMKNRISVIDTNMLRERSKFLNFENNKTRRTDSKIK